MRESVQVPGAVLGTGQCAWQALSIIKMFSSAHLYQLLLHNQSPQSSEMDLITVNITSMFKLRLRTVTVSMAPESTAQCGLGCNGLSLFCIVAQPGAG